MSRVAAIIVVLVAAMGIFAGLAVTSIVSAAPNTAVNALKNPNSMNAVNALDLCRIPANLSVGQTITLTSTQGAFHIVGDSSETGTASGMLTFTVTGAFKAGYTLTLTSGSIDLNGTTYTIASGSAETGPFAQNIVGQGQTSPTGSFLLHAKAEGNFGGSVMSTVKIDFNDSTTEYAIGLICDIVG